MFRFQSMNILLHLFHGHKDRTLDKQHVYLKMCRSAFLMLEFGDQVPISAAAAEKAAACSDMLISPKFLFRPPRETAALRLRYSRETCRKLPRAQLHFDPLRWLSSIVQFHLASLDLRRKTSAWQLAVFHEEVDLCSVPSISRYVLT